MKLFKSTSCLISLTMSSLLLAGCPGTQNTNTNHNLNPHPNVSIVFDGSPTANSATFRTNNRSVIHNLTVKVKKQINNIVINPPSVSAVLSAADTTTGIAPDDRLEVLTSPTTVTATRQETIQVKQKAGTTAGIHVITVELKNDNGATEEKTVNFIVRRAIAGPIESLVTSSDGQYMLAGSKDDKIYVSSDHGQNWSVGVGTGGDVNSVATSSNGKYMIAGSSDNKIYVSSDYGTTWPVEENTGAIVRSVATSSDGKYMLAGGQDGKIYVSNDNGANWSLEETTGDVVNSLATSSDGKYMISGSSDNNIYVSSDHGQNWSLEGTGGAVTSVSTSSDGKYMLSDSADGNIYL